MAGNLLLAIDNPDVLYLIRRYADECGLHTRASRASDEACRLAEMTQPEAIILEVQDGQAGLSVLRALKAAGTTRDIPVIVYCGQDHNLIGLPDDVSSLCQPVLYRDFTAALQRAGILSCPPTVLQQHNTQRGTRLMRSEAASKQDLVSAGQPGWSIRMSDAVMCRLPLLSDEWRYEPGVMLTALRYLWLKTHDNQYFDYIKANIDALVEPDGNIRTYRIEEFNLDQINEGKLLCFLYQETGEEKYRKAADLLREQLRRHPRTSENGFWHKQIYPHQMWLDGIYMGCPFYAEYGRVFGEPAAYDDVTLQLRLVDRHTRDNKTDLLYHAWDESKSQVWADPETGHSRHFWGRAIGWYLMALVDVLDILPEDHPERGRVITFLGQTVPALGAVQDASTGVWFQILDQGAREGNYLEASASCMFVYAIAKGVRRGYIDQKYLGIARKGYAGILSEFIKVDEEGQPHVHGICSVAGLDKRRNGTFDYYISEKVVADDLKGVGPFVMASTEMEYGLQGLGIGDQGLGD